MAQNSGFQACNIVEVTMFSQNVKNLSIYKVTEVTKVMVVSSSDLVTKLMKLKCPFPKI